MADIRRVHGRQSEAHQFPIQFAASPARLANSRPDATPRHARGQGGGEGAFHLGTLPTRGMLVQERRFQASFVSIPSSHVA